MEEQVAREPRLHVEAPDHQREVCPEDRHEDVSEEFRDLSLRLRNAREVRDRLLLLLEQAKTVEESIKLFREKGLQDEANAEQQANRGTFDPAYLNYTMGKLMIRKLRDDWCATRGGKAAWKDFHDQFLRYGGPPIPMVRKAMMGADDKGSLF